MKKGKIIYIIVVSIIIIVVGLISYLLIFENKTSENSDNKTLKGILFKPKLESKIVNKDNFEEISNEVTEKYKDKDEMYYYSYCVLYHSINDGLSVSFDFSLTDEQKEEKMYSNIFGKTVKALIQEGKNLMKENNVTIEEFKKTLLDAKNELK